MKGSGAHRSRHDSAQHTQKKRVPSASTRLQPLPPQRPPQRSSSRKSGGAGPQRGGADDSIPPGSGGTSRGRSPQSRLNDPPPTKPSSAGVSRVDPSHGGGRSRNNRSSDGQPPLPSSAGSSAHNSTPLFSAPIPQLPINPGKLRRQGRPVPPSPNVEVSLRTRGASEPLPGSPPPVGGGNSSSNSVAVVSRSEAHSRSKALADGSPSSMRGKLNLTPTKPKAGEVSRQREDEGHQRAHTESGSSSHQRGGGSSGGSAIQSAAAPAAAGKKRSKSRGEEVGATLPEAPPYGDRKTWKQVPSRATKILDGRALEPHFTTHLWKQAYDHPDEEFDSRDVVDTASDGSNNPHVHQYDHKLRDGYYACVRCRVPICSPRYQVMHVERGIAIFQHVNAAAVDVELDLSGGNEPRRGGGITFEREKGVIQFLVFCKYCRGCLGVCSVNVPSGVDAPSGEIFYANSCCLVYMRYRTSEKLDGTIVDNHMQDDDSHAGESERDELSVLEDDDFGLDITEFDSDDESGAKKPFIEFPSDDDYDED